MPPARSVVPQILPVPVPPPGYCWLTAPGARSMEFGFALETIDGRLLCFDAWTGQLLEGWERAKFVK